MNEQNIISNDMIDSAGGNVIVPPTLSTPYIGTSNLVGGYLPQVGGTSFSNTLRQSLTDTSNIGRYVEHRTDAMDKAFRQKETSPFYEYGSYSLDDRYNRLNDGSFVKKYDVYQQGYNNEEFNAQ